MFLHSRGNAARQCIHPLNAAFITILHISLCSFCSEKANAQSLNSGDSSSSDSHTATINQEESKYRELAITVAADLDSPAHAQAVAVIVEQSITSERFDSPIRMAIMQFVKIDQFSESRLLAAVRLLPASTIPPQEQVAILLDSLVILSQQETLFGQQLRVGFLNEGPRTSILLNLIIAQLSAAPAALAEELENRFKQGTQPSVTYSTVALSNSHGVRLIPYLLQASRDSDPFVKAATFLSLRKTYTNAETASGEVMKKKFRPESENIFFRGDIDLNLVLTPDEWSKMLVNPATADISGDGKIDLEEYVDWFVKRKINQLKLSR